MLLLSLLLLFIFAPIIWLLRPHRSTKAGWLAALPPLAITIWLITQLGAVQHGHEIIESYVWADALNLVLRLRLDGLALFFGIIISGIGAGVALYTAYYLEGDSRQGYFYALLYAFMACMLGVVWSDNLMTLFVFWEGTSITSYLMVGYDHKSKVAQDGARRALIVTGSGGLAMLAGFVILAQAAGTYTISQLLTQTNLIDLPIFPAALILILLGAFTKSAQFPFQFWLPGAMSAPTPASAYLHSATMVKAGIYLLARLHPAFSHSTLWFWALLIIGGITMLLGAISALRYYDLKKILAYATVSQLGILVFLLAFDDKYAYAAVVVGILAHALYKGPLFMLAGIIDHATGTRDIRRLAGLWRAMPWTFAIAVMAMLSMAGLPPLFGFVAKETLLETLFHYAEHGGGLLGWTLLGAAAIVGAFFVGYSLTLLYETFLRPTPTDENNAAHIHHAPSIGFVFAPLTLAAIGTIIPFVIGPLGDTFLSAAASSIAGEDIHLHLALWHGVTPYFITSLIAIATGVIIFLLRASIRRLWTAAPESLDGVRIFNRIYSGSYDIARWSTRHIQGGSLAAQASVVLLCAVGFLLLTLTRLDPVADLTIDWGTFPELHELVIAILAVVAAIVTVQAKSRLNAIISIGVVGVTVTLFFVYFRAPDLALTQLLIETLTVVLLVLVFHKVPPDKNPPLHAMANMRNIIVSVAVGLLGFMLVLFSAGEPFEPRISDFFTLNSVPAAHGANIVNVILVDFRGIDTLGEITVLAIAALGGYALLRSVRLRQIDDVEPVWDREDRDNVEDHA